MSAGKQCKSRDLVVTAKKKMLARLKRERKARRCEMLANGMQRRFIKTYLDHPVKSK